MQTLLGKFVMLKSQNKFPVRDVGRREAIMAKISIVGNIFQKREDKEQGSPAISVSYTEKGTAIAKFTVQENRKFGKTNESKYDYWAVSVMGNSAEFVEKHFSSGSPIVLFGEIYHSKGKDGKNYDNVVISDVDFGPKDFSEVNQQPIGNATVQPAPTQVQQTPPQAAPQQAPVQNQVAQAPQQQPIQNPPVQQPVYQQAPTGDPGFEPPLGVNGF